MLIYFNHKKEVIRGKLIFFKYDIVKYTKEYLKFYETMILEIAF